jgi:hypothetical protein
VIGELQTSGHGKGPAMQGVHAIGIYESWEIRGTSDPADSDHAVVRQLQFNQGLFDSHENTEITAAGTPVGLHFAFQISQSYLVGTLDASRHLSLLLKP